MTEKTSTPGFVKNESGVVLNTNLGELEIMKARRAKSAAERDLNSRLSRIEARLSKIEAALAKG